MVAPVSSSYFLVITVSSSYFLVVTFNTPMLEWQSV